LATGLSDVIQAERLKLWLSSTFSELGITSVEMLKSDEKMRQVAMSLYDRIPLVPYRAVIKATLGKDGFTAFVFRIRDKMLQAGSTDLSWLNLEQLKLLLPIVPPI
jgi:hypothetical protein